MDKDISQYCKMEFTDFLQSHEIIQSAIALIKENAKSLDFYNRHFVPCTKVCYDLSHNSEEDLLDAVLLGLFHDYGKNFIDDRDNHEIIGAEKAKEFLIKNNYDYKRTLEIAQAIRNHKGNANDKDLSVLSKIIIDADSISYIQEIDYFFQYLLDSNCSYEDAREIVQQKIEHNKLRMSVKGHDYLQEHSQNEDIKAK